MISNICVLSECKRKEKKMAKQVLIRIADELYGDLQREAIAHKLTVQKYILSILDSESSLIRQIDNSLKDIKNDLYEERIMNNIMYGYIKKILVHIEESIGILHVANPNLRRLTGEEKEAIARVADKMERDVLKEIVEGKDVFRMSKLYSMAHPDEEGDGDENTRETRDNKE